MALKVQTTAKGSAEAFKYLMLFVAGVLIILLCSLFQSQSPVEGEYHYSSFLRVNFTWVAKILFALTAVATAYFYGLNPWGIGFCLVSIFPLTSLIEGSVYPQSHNLLGFEIVLFIIYAVPSIIMAAIGKFIRKRVAKKNAEKSKPVTLKT